MTADGQDVSAPLSTRTRTPPCRVRRHYAVIFNFLLSTLLHQDEQVVALTNSVHRPFCPRFTLRRCCRRACRWFPVLSGHQFAILLSRDFRVIGAPRRSDRLSSCSDREAAASETLARCVCCACCSAFLQRSHLNAVACF